MTNNQTTIRKICFLIAFAVIMVPPCSVAFAAVPAFASFGCVCLCRFSNIELLFYIPWIRHLHDKCTNHPAFNNES